MRVPREVLELENRSLGRGAEPTLFRAYEPLITEWRSGSRDRELNPGRTGFARPPNDTWHAGPSGDRLNLRSQSVISSS